MADGATVKHGEGESAEVIKLRQDEFAKLMKDAANAAVDAYESKRTDPATRPAAMPIVETKDSDFSEAPKGFLPPGSAWKDGFNVNVFPKGELNDNFSMARLIRAQTLAKQNGGDFSFYKKIAPWETAYYGALASKAQAEATGQDGGFLAPVEWINQLYNILRPASVLERLPITRMRMGTRVSHIPRVTGDVTVSYAAENATLTSSTLQFSQTSFTARKQYTYVQVSNELIADSAPDADNAIRTEAGRAMAVDRDKQSIQGNGQSGAPTGLINMTNITTTSLAGTPTYANVVTGVSNVRNLNNSTNVPTGQADCTGVLYNIQFEQTVLSMLDSNNRPLWQYGLSNIGRVPQAGWLGVPNWIGSNALTSGNSANIIYGDWQYFLLMERQDIEVLASNVAGTAFASDQTWIRITYRYDVGCVHPEAFFVHSNAHA